MEKVELLRRKRGDERVTFGDVCDHLIDFAEQRPEHAGIVEHLAQFMARVEDVDHDHTDGPKGSSA